MDDRQGGEHEPSLGYIVLVFGRGRGMGRILDGEDLVVVLGVVHRSLSRISRRRFELGVGQEVVHTWSPSRL